MPGTGRFGNLIGSALAYHVAMRLPNSATAKTDSPTGSCRQNPFGFWQMEGDLCVCSARGRLATNLNGRLHEPLVTDGACNQVWWL